MLSKNPAWAFAELWLRGSAAGGAFRDCVVWSGRPAADL